MIKRCIMEAGDDATGKNVCMQMTFHGYTEDEITATIFEAEKFWDDVKERLLLKDEAKSDKETAATEETLQSIDSTLKRIEKLLESHDDPFVPEDSSGNMFGKSRNA